MNRLVIGAIAVTAITLIVFVAIGSNMLGLLIFGVMLLGVISIVLARIGFNLFSQYTDAVLKRDALRFEHAERAMRQGFLPEGSGFLIYKQIEDRIQKSAPPALPDPKQGIHFTDSNLETNVVNLLLYSVQLLGEDSNRIASGPECSAANIPGYNSRKWSNMVHDYLEPKYDVATVQGPVDKGGGTYVPDSIGSIGKLYHDIVYKSGLDALPTTRK